MNVDAAVTRHNDAQIEPLFPQLEQVHERALEMKRVRDNVAVVFAYAEAFDDEILAAACVGLCGDGILSSNEECDDGNQLNTDACKNNCSNSEND